MSRQSQFEYKIVIVTRADLKLSTGKIIAQACHAAVDCVREGKAGKPHCLEEMA